MRNNSSTVTENPRQTRDLVGDRGNVAELPARDPLGHRARLGYFSSRFVPRLSYSDRLIFVPVIVILPAYSRPSWCTGHVSISDILGRMDGFDRHLA